MNDEQKKKILLISCAVLIVGVILAKLMPGEMQDNAYTIGRIFAVAGVVFVLIYLLVLPSLYRKKLDEKVNKSLRTLIMMDPQFRDAMTKRSKVQNWQGDEPPPAEPKPEPAKPDQNDPPA